MSLLEFAQRFATTEACLKHLESTRWANGEFCPRCGSERRIYHFKDGVRHKCADCRAIFRITAGTMFGDSPLRLLPKWFAAIYLVTEHRKGISSVQLARDIGVTQKTAWYMMHRIHKAAGKAFEEGKLLGPVEMDEAYFGGNMGSKKKGKRQGRKGYSGQDSAILGMKERGGRVRAFRIERPTTNVITPIIHRELAPHARIYTDESGLYIRAGKSFPRYSVTHSRDEWVRGEVHSQGIESFWATLRRAYYGVHHWWSRKHAQRYADGAAFRVNVKGLDGPARVALLVKTGAEPGCRLEYRRLVA